MKTQPIDKATFKERLAWWAERLEIDAHTVVVRPMKNKWASCSTSGRMTFDAKLLDLPVDLQDYVIVHELLHFHVPNHGKLWKSLMHAHLGDYEKKEKQLRKYAVVKS
jgi:predicted metal-dependent hydrolase